MLQQRASTTHLGLIGLCCTVALTGCLGDTTTAPDPTSDSANREAQSNPGTDPTDDLGAVTLATTPVEAMELYVAAWNERDTRQLVRLLGHRFIFHTSNQDGLPETWNRVEMLGASRRIFDGTDVMDVSLSMDWLDPQPAGDPVHPDWLEVSVVSVQLSVEIRDDFNNIVVFQVDGDPARFILGPRPSFDRRNTGWQIMSQWDLSEGERGDDGRSVVIPMTWSRLLAQFM